jgi:hypothetical protein
MAERGTSNAKFIIPAVLALWLVSTLLTNKNVPGWLKGVAGVAMGVAIVGLVVFLFLRQSGWWELARRYPAVPALAAERWRTCRTAVLSRVGLDQPAYERSKVRLSFILRVGSDDQALYVSAISFLWPLLPPIRLPWNAIARVRYFDPAGWVRPTRDRGALLQLTYDPGYTGHFVEIEVAEPTVFVQLPAALLTEAIPHFPSLPGRPAGP